MDKKNLKLNSKIDVNYILSNYFPLIASIIFFVVLGAGYLFLIDPYLDEIKLQISQDIATEKNYGVIQQQKINKLIEQREAFDKINIKELEKIDYILPKEEDIPNLFAQIEAIAKEYSLLLTSISTSNYNEETKNGEIVKPPNSVKKVLVSITLDGGSDYEALKNFLKALEFNIRLLDISSINISSDFRVYNINCITYYK
jgi:Tfp pilus assembly protein PilO